MKFCYQVRTMFKNISPDLVRSGRTCPVNLGVHSCPVRKLICPVRLSPRRYPYKMSNIKFVQSGSLLYSLPKSKTSKQPSIEVSNSIKKLALSITIRDVTVGEFLVRTLQCWAESAPPCWNRIKVSENIGATAVEPVASAVTSLFQKVRKYSEATQYCVHSGLQQIKGSLANKEILISTIS